MSNKITILATSGVQGPNGFKLVVGKHYEFDDSKYVRILVESGAVELVDPPSFDYIDRPAVKDFHVGGTIEKPVAVSEIYGTEPLNPVKSYKKIKEVKKEDSYGIDINNEEKGTTNEEV